MHGRSRWEARTGSLLAGRYELLERIATGGMGTVHRALDRTTGREVAVKLLADPGSSEVVERFHREARILAELDHPSIVRFVDFGAIEGGPLYLVMEWLAGVDLARKLQDGVLPCATVVRLARLVAEALAVAHDLGVIHRDVKPHNIFLVGGSMERVKILDFGIALVEGRTTGITRTGMTVGTPEYMPPEQARGERRVDARIDVYALGCVIFQCLTGSPPFWGPTAASIIAELLLNEAPRLASRAPDVPPDLDDLVASMLAKDPASRPASARALAERLHAIEGTLETTPDVARPAVSTDERRLVSLVAIAPAVESTSDARATVEIMSSSGADTASIQRVAGVHGGELRVLPGRGAVLLFVSDAPAQAALAGARAALELVREDRTLRLALVAGPASVRAGPDPPLLARALDAATTSGQVRVDDVAKGLVSGAMEVEMTEGGPVLRGERRLDPQAANAFVGRDREIATLLAAHQASVADSAAHAVIVTGAAGLGKSRLLREVVERVRATSYGSVLIEARAEEVRRHAPFAALGALVRRGLGVPEAASPAEQVVMLRAAVDAWVDPTHAARVAAFLCVAAGLEPPDRDAVEVAAALRDPQLMDDQVERATFDFVEALTRRFGSAVLLLDDAHWADAATLKVLARAMRRMSDRPLLVVVFARPELDEYAPHLFRERASQRLQLGGLPRRAAERLVGEALGERASPSAVERIVSRADGNPLFLRELVSSQIERGPVSEAPANVLASVEARILRLEPSARKILRAASVFGDTFWQAGLAALLGAESAETRMLGDWLVHLVDRDVFVPRRATRFSGHPELAFRHPLLREAAYAMLTPEDRVEGHRRAAAWLLGVGERDAALLAHHLDAAHDQSAAAVCYAQAAQTSLARNDLVRAVAHAERALERGLDGEDRGRVLSLVCEARYWMGEPERGVETGREAVAALAPGTQAWLEALSVRARCLARTGNPAVIDAAREIVRAVAADVHLVPAANALPDLVSSTLRRGLRDLAEEILDVVGQAALARSADPLRRAHVLTCRSWQAMFDGDFAACVSYDAEVLRCMREAGDHRQACLSRVHVGYDYLMLGAYERAAEELSAAQEEAERAALDAVENLAKHNLALALHRLGDSARALEMQRECVAQALAHKNLLAENHARRYVALILYDEGDLDGAAAELEKSLARMPTSAMKWDALARLAMIALRRGDVPGAKKLADEAVAGLEQDRNAEEGEAFVRLAAVEIDRAAGDEVSARAHLVKARNRLLWRAGRIADPALRRSFMRAVPEHARTLELAEALAVGQDPPSHPSG